MLKRRAEPLLEPPVFFYEILALDFFLAFYGNEGLEGLATA
jgi:hypothetical protein